MPWGGALREVNLQLCLRRLNPTARAKKKGSGTFFLKLRVAAKRFLTPFLLIVSAAAHAEQCRVIDRELQGSYSGPCVNGLAEGKGVAKGTASYEGDFKAGRKSGHGVKTWANGDRYEGDFVDDRKEGYGAYTWGRGPWEGESYQGAYRADKRSGLGVYRWPSGDVYSGPWENDAFTGTPTGMMRARGTFEREAIAAVGKVGQKVCREVEVGIGGREWLRGEVTEVKGAQVGVRIDDPGEHGRARKGEVMWDEATAWVPCY
jgi:hypothetical protein